jgi:hypothetical protein
MRDIGKAERRDSAPTECNPEGRRSLAPGGVAAPLTILRSLRDVAPTLAPKIAVAAHAGVRNGG